MSAWRPIETAPRDGTIVLAWQDRGAPYIARYDMHQWWTDDIRYADHYYPPTCNPTHWMPLPEPPQ